MLAQDVLNNVFSVPIYGMDINDRLLYGVILSQQRRCVYGRTLKHNSGIFLSHSRHEKFLLVLKYLVNAYRGEAIIYFKMLQVNHKLVFAYWRSLGLKTKFECI